MNTTQTASIARMMAASGGREATEDTILAYHLALADYQYEEALTAAKKLLQRPKERGGNWNQSDIAREIAHGRVEQNYFKATPQQRADYDRQMAERRFVKCVYTRRSGERIEKWEHVDHCYNDGERWWPKIEYIIHQLGDGVTKRFMNIGVHRLARDPKQAQRYFIFREKLLDEAIGAAEAFIANKKKHKNISF